MTKGNSFTHQLTPMQLIELDACTLCGECLKCCPVQDVTGNPTISPPEKIRIFRQFIKATEGLKARLLGPEKVDEKLLEHFVGAVYECTTCGACGKNCSVGIFTQRLWPALRREMVRRGLGPIGPQAELPKAIGNSGNPYDKPWEERYAPWFPEKVKVAQRAEIAYYAGCTGAYEAHPMVRGDVLVLGAIGESFTMLPPEEEVCCGFPLFITGQHEMLADLTKRLVGGYRARGVKLLLCSCPCCVNIMVRDWPLLYGSELPFAVRHITQFVSEALQKKTLVIRKELRERLIYHDPCYLSRGVGVVEEPRTILRSIPGIQLLEFERHGLNSRCCGAGGAARKVFHENAIAMGRLSIDEAVGKKADRLILSCPACYSKMNEALEGYQKQVKITDIMELLSGLVT
ncbi:MAG TPA: (Fe-S)-binding protein [Thermodesulfovibrionales bacterium]|nr:(Fe-S)-binding protein [Thermodesulfovibrionales bacterium]